MSAWLRVGLIMSALALTLVACGSSPKPALYTLADGIRPVPTKIGFSIAVMPTTLPELYDRPQLVVRHSDSRVLILDQQRWAEPLRQEISRRVAADLGQRIGSAAIVALPEDVQSLNPDFRLLLDVQRIDASLSEGVGVDVAWRLLARDGKVRAGRSVVVEKVALAGGAPYAALVDAYRRAFGRVSDDVAAALGEVQAVAR